MSKTQADYYLDNPNARLVALMRRVAALERRLGIVAPQMDGQEGAAVTMPDALLPSAAEIPRWLLLDRAGGGIYRVDGEVLGGKMRLHFVYIGQAREPEGAV